METKLQFKSGMVTDVTPTSAEGAWVDGDKVRFRLGMPEKLGGWVKYNKTPFVGECNTLRQWSSLTSDRYQGLATTLKTYIESSGNLYDVTPIRRNVTLGNNAILPNGMGSTLITVTDVLHGAAASDYVTISGVVSGGQLIASQVNREWQIASVIDANTYAIDVGVAVAGPGLAFGGNLIVAKYQVTAGVNNQIIGSGWGTGPYGRGAWSSAYTDTVNALRIWSLDNFGEELLMLPNYGQIYVWQPTNGLAVRAIAISSISGANMTPLAALQLAITENRHVVCYGCNDWNTTTLDPMLVRWCAQQNYLDWEPRADNTSGSYRLSKGSGIVAQLPAQNETLIWTDNTLYSQQFVGPPYTFGFIQVSDGVRIIGPNAAANARNSVYWMDSNGFFSYNGTVLPLECPLREYIFNDFNVAQRYKVWAGTNAAFNEIWWGYPSKNSTVCDRIVIYNFATAEWAKGTLVRSAWTDLSLDGKPVAAGGQNLYKHEQGMDDDVSPMYSYIESGDMDIGDGDTWSFIRKIVPDIAFGTDGYGSPQCTVSLKKRDFPGSSLETSASVIVLPGTEDRNVRVRGRQIVFRVESSGSGMTWRLGTPRLDLQTDGRR